MIGIIIGVAIILVILVFVIVTYNSLISSKNMVKEAFSTMDVYLKKRWDLVPNLVETVKGYAKHEEGTFKAVVEARNKAVNAGSVGFSASRISLEMYIW